MILEQIPLYKQQELEYQKRCLPITELRKMAWEQPPPCDFAAALQGDGIKLIAEVKKASPSRA